MLDKGGNKKPDLLIVDDDPLITDTLNYVLSRDFSVYVAESRSQVQSVLRQVDESPQLALIDLGLPPTPHVPDEGFKLIGELIAQVPGIKIVVLSGQNDDANARHARTLGAIEFVSKPCEPDDLKKLLLQALEIRDVEREAAATDDGLIGDSPPLRKLREQIVQYARSPFSVLIEGESGSGKELVASALHRLSERAGKPFLALNCAAISPTLVEPTLFGYSKGSFTGATNARSGYFEDAKDGTLFLDEIGELPLELQAKLLRVLENGEYQRVGETQSRFSNARVIAATNRDMRREMRNGRFRSDLYHRLSVFTIDVPALRELGDDKERLLEHFRSFYTQQAGSRPFELDPAAQQLWLDYGFPGNVRELRNIVIRLITKHGGTTVTPDQLRSELDLETVDDATPTPAIAHDFRATLDAACRHLQSQQEGFDLDHTLQQWERGYVEAALTLTQGNLTRAAKLLGIHRTTLYSRMQHYNSSSQAESGT
jgi:DNA-binding NtrC family response regulator